MERSSRRGKIPQKDWPSIISRYEAGETLASIARTYDCSPPAISYIVSRNRARNSAADGAEAEPAGPQLIKIQPAPQPAPTDGAAAAGNEESPAASQTPELLRERLGVERPGEPKRHSEPPLFDRARENPGAIERNPLLRREAGSLESGGAARPAAAPFASANHSAPHSLQGPAPNGGQRRTLHLSLGSSGQGESGGARPPVRQHPQPAGGEPMSVRPQGPPPARPSEPLFSGRGGFEGRAPREGLEPQGTKEAASSLDGALRQRVDTDIAAFLAAFDGALENDTAESRALLREATDRLLRAGARTRIELERLEARLPLPPREKSAEAGSAWRQR